MDHPNELIRATKLSPQGRKISESLSILVTSLLILTVALYAGFRGNFVYNHDPASLTKYEEKETVNYPAATVCPLGGDTTVQPEVCLLEFQEQPFTNCMFAVKETTVYYDGINRSCHMFNYDGSLVSKTPDDEFIVSLSVSSTNSSNQTALGALVFVHAFFQQPTLNTVGSFIADVSKFTNVWLKINRYQYVNGTHTTVYSANKVSSATMAIPQPNTVNINFVFPDSGVYEQIEYYPYTIYDWMGEVGGFAFLMTCLHFAVTLIINIILMKALPPKDAKSTDSADEHGSQLGDPKI